MRSDWVQRCTLKVISCRIFWELFYWIVKKVQNFNVLCRVTPTFKNVCTERLANFYSFYLFVRFSRFLLWYYTDFISVSEKGWLWVCWYCHFGRNNFTKIGHISRKSAKVQPKYIDGNLRLFHLQNFFDPFSVKLFAGIFCDSLSLPGLGRRKTWVLVGHTLMVIALMTFYWKFDEWVESKSILNICVVKLLLYSGAAIQGKSIIRIFGTRV